MIATAHHRSHRRDNRPAEFTGPKSAAHVLALACVWLAFASSGIVFSEPAPVDALTIGLMILLPAAGLVVINPLLMTYLSVWMVAAASACLAATLSLDLEPSAIHTGVSLYLYASSFIFAGFVARRPVEHTNLLFSGWLAAALAAGLAGMMGYFSAFPGAAELFTKFGRAAGTFKDPNVFGPFLVAPFLYCLHLALDRSAAKTILPLAAAGFLAAALFLSFSRGAWINLGVATALYAYLSVVTAPNTAQRHRIAGFMVAGALVVTAVVLLALQFDAVTKLVDQRATFDQGYDNGPDGRFGGQGKAVGLILSNPLGIGAQQFSPVYHHEEVHNVYLSTVLNAGWLGGGIYWIMVALTAGLGFRHSLKATAARPLFLIAYAAFIATAAEGSIIDTDHWRHFYLLMAIVWGLMSVPREVRP
jgi:O-Antigen ligase